MDLNASTKKSLWSFDYVLILIINFIIAIVYGTLNALIPQYVVTELGSSTGMAGYIASFLAAGAITCRITFGNLSDRLDRKKILCLGACLFALMTALYNFRPTILPLTLLRILHGAANGIYTGAIGGILASIVPASRLMDGLAFYSLTPTLANAIGPSFGATVVDTLGFPALFLCLICLAAIAAGLCFLIRFRSEIKPALPKTGENAFKRVVGMLEPHAFLPAIIVLVINIGCASVNNFILLYGKESGIANIALYFTVNSVALCASRTFSSPLARKMGIRAANCVSVVVIALGIFLVAAGGTLPYILLSAVFNGLGTGLLLPMLNSFVYQLCKPERKGAAQATYQSTLEAGRGIGAALWGSCIGMIGYVNSFYLSSACVLIALILYFIAIEPHVRSGRVHV